MEDENRFQEEYEKLLSLFKKQISETTVNTRERMSVFRMFITEAYAKNPMGNAARLEACWKVLTENATKLEDTRDADLGQTPIEKLLAHMATGVYPPPEVLMCISECFEDYLYSGGSKSLDEAFYGKAHKKKSSAAYHFKQDKIFMKFDSYLLGCSLADMGFRDVDFPSGALTEKADEFLKLLGGKEQHVEPASFLKQWRRWGKTSKNYWKAYERWRMDEYKRTGK